MFVPKHKYVSLNPMPPIAVGKCEQPVSAHENVIPHRVLRIVVQMQCTAPFGIGVDRAVVDNIVFHKRIHFFVVEIQSVRPIAVRAVDQIVTHLVVMPCMAVDRRPVV